MKRTHSENRSLIIIYYRFFKSQAVFGNFFDWQIPARSDPSDLSDLSDKSECCLLRLIMAYSAHLI